MFSPVQSRPASPVEGVFGYKNGSIGDDDQSLRDVFAIMHLDQFGPITVMDMQRGYAMAAHHNITPRRIKAVAFDLSLPTVDGTIERTKSSERRVALACMLSLRFGFQASSAQELVDQARSKDAAEVVKFIVHEAAIAAIATGTVYGACLVVGKAASAITTKAAMLKAGGLGAKAAFGASTGMVGFAVLAWGSVVGAGNMVEGCLAKAAQVCVDHADELEATWLKDARILEGIKIGRFNLPNRAPQPQRAA